MVLEVRDLVAKVDQALSGADPSECLKRLVNVISSNDGHSLEPHVIDTINLFLHYKHSEAVQNALRLVITANFELYVNGKHHNWDKHWGTVQLLQWPHIYRNTCRQILGEIIQKKVEDICNADFDEPTLDPLLAWLDEQLLPFAAQIFSSSVPSKSAIGSLKYVAIERLVEVRFKMIFEMITDFPDSLSALLELKQCLAQSDSIGLGKPQQFSLILALL